MEEKKLTDEAVNATVKSLKWVCNQIPDDLGDSNEERMLKCIRLYCEKGIAVINRQKAEIEQLTEEKWQAQDDLDNYHAMYQEEVKANAELQKQVEVLTVEKENLYFLNKNLEDYIDNHEPIWKRNTEQAVKDTAEEILDEVSKHYGGAWLVELYKKYGVEVE